MKIQVGDRQFDSSQQPLLMGILNVTPDSFSDGGLYLQTDSALARAGQMAAEGAVMIDVGGESTQPGSSPVPPREQIQRTQSVIAAIRRSLPDVAVSIDTQSAEVAEAALDAGAEVINDISGLRHDPAMVRLAAERQVPVVLMHIQGAPATMQENPAYEDVVAEVAAFLTERAGFAISNGIGADRIIVDPGIGFGKNLEHNLSLLANLETFTRGPYPVLLGVSRKSFMGRLLNLTDPRERVAASMCCSSVAALCGVAIFRTHDVAATRQAIQIGMAIRSRKRT